MADFDPIKALTEELAGLNEVGNALKKRELHLHAAMSSAEIELNGVKLLIGFTRQLFEDKRNRLRQLQEAAK